MKRVAGPPGGSLAVLALVAQSVLAAQTTTEPESEFAERISVMAVEIPVRVLVDGRPVAGLTKESFRVFEGSTEHEIVGFEEVDLNRSREESEPVSGPAAASGSLLPGDGRRLLLLFDTASSGRRPIARAVKGARWLATEGAHPADRIAVASYSGLRGLAFLTGFTADREATLLALDVIEAGVGGDRRAHGEATRALAGRGGLVTAGSPLERFRRLSEQFGQSAAIAFEAAEADLGVFALAGGDRATGSVGGRFDFVEPLRDPVRASYQNTAPGQIAAGLNRAVGSSGVRALALELIELATVLRDLPGQKHLFFLSRGFSSQLLEDATSLHHLEKALEALRRANWAIQAIDIGGVGFDAHSLFYLANETGGELIENHLDLEQAAVKLVARTAVSYVLTIQPTDVPADGRYHRLSVRLSNGRRGRVRLVHRPGYYAPKPRAQRNNLENTLDAARLLLSDRQTTELAAEVLALPLPGRELAQVPVVVEVPAVELDLETGVGLRMEIHGYALDGQGQIQDLFSQRLRLGRRKARELAEIDRGVRFYDRVALPPGEYSLRVLVRDLTSGDSYLTTLPLAIAAFRSEPELHGPLFVTDDDWTVLRGEGSLNGGRGVEHPFVLAGQPRIPSLRPVLVRGDRALFFLKTQRLDAADLRLRARVVDDSGQTVEGAELAFRERILDDESRVDALIGTLAPERLEPGSYRLEITASWDGGAKRRMGLGEFQVAGR